MQELDLITKGQWPKVPMGRSIEKREGKAIVRRSVMAVW